MNSTNETSKEQLPSSPARRHWLKGVSAGAVAVGAIIGAGATLTTQKATSSSNEADSTQEHQDFFGDHQAGITTPQPASAIFAAFDVLAGDRAGLEKLFRTLTERIAFLTEGGAIQQIDPKLPPANSGVLGQVVFPDNLTVTVSVGSSLFDGRFGLADKKPKHLIEMERFPNDALEPEMCHGDLTLQICSNTAETNIHALREIIKHTPELLSLRWKMDGFLPPHMIRKLGKDTARNLLGFKDGTANIDAKDSQLMSELVWVGEHANSASEPSWAKGGSYQVVRFIRNHVEFWDRTPLQEQQTIMGRHKETGAPLGMKNEKDIPNYAADPDGDNIPLNAHIRLANPRTAETRKSLILRRGYNYSRGMSKSGQLDMGLLFVCYQSNLSNGFVTVQNRLNGEGLEEYITPFGGGFFFSLPGVKKGEYLGQTLLT